MQYSFSFFSSWALGQKQDSFRCIHGCPRHIPQLRPASRRLMSGVMIKTGIYGILRILSVLVIPDIRLAYGVLIISIITGIYGVANAIAQHDLKKLLAYHSIENIGIIGMGIGVGMLGCGVPEQAFLRHLVFLEHCCTRSTILLLRVFCFMGRDTLSQTHTRDIEKLGGLKNIYRSHLSCF